jgi:hypothetical protein
MFYKTIWIPAFGGMTLKMVCGNFHAYYWIMFFVELSKLTPVSFDSPDTVSLEG